MVVGVPVDKMTTKNRSVSQSVSQSVRQSKNSLSWTFSLHSHLAPVRLFMKISIVRTREMRVTKKTARLNQ